jgi:hypothetical protein
MKNLQTIMAVFKEAAITAPARSVKVDLSAVIQGSNVKRHMRKE